MSECSFGSQAPNCMEAGSGLCSTIRAGSAAQDLPLGCCPLGWFLLEILKLGLARCILEGGRIGKVCVRGPGLRSCSRNWAARAGSV
ncbi:unnamed protein product [Prunus armeniaca]